jgi:hypothetical protein
LRDLTEEERNKMLHASVIEVERFGRFVIYDSGIPGETSRFYAEGVAGPRITLPDTGSSLEELKEKLTKYPK